MEKGGASTLAIGILGMSLGIVCGVMCRKPRHRIATRVLSLIASIFFPMGTIAGLMTFIALGSPRVREAYDEMKTNVS